MTFSEDLKFGLDSERRLAELYPFLVPVVSREYDYFIKHTKIKVEKKADAYDPARYGNIIIEKYSHGEAPGGPWQSKKHGVRYYLYWFVQTGDLYVFDVVQLLARMRKLEKKKGLKLFDKQNRGYITRFYKVPIADLEDINLGIEKLERIYEVAAARKARSERK